MRYVDELRTALGPRPLLIVGAAVIVLNDSQEVLLQLRTDTEDWSVPSGAMELGESLEETAARQLLEETGLKGRSFRFLGVLSGREMYYKYPNGDEAYHIINVFQSESVTGALQTNEERLAMEYFPVGKLPKLNVITERILYKFLFALTE